MDFHNTLINGDHSGVHGMYLRLMFEHINNLFLKDISSPQAVLEYLLVCLIYS